MKFRPQLEALEDRAVPATIYWEGGQYPGPFDWFDGDNWSGGTVPTINDDVYISEDEDPCVIDGAGAVASTLTIGGGGTLTILDGGSLILSSTADITGGWLILDNGQITSSTMTIENSGYLQIESGGGEISGAVVVNAGSVQVVLGATLDISSHFTRNSGSYLYLSVGETAQGNAISSRVDIGGNYTIANGSTMSIDRGSSAHTYQHEWTIHTQAGSYTNNNGSIIWTGWAGTWNWDYDGADGHIQSFTL